MPTFHTANLTVDSITLTVTHALARAPALLRVILTPRNAAAADTVGDGAFIADLQTNHLLIRTSTDDGALVDLTVIEFHSIQGNG